jgi:hypothetical protein
VYFKRDASQPDIIAYVRLLILVQKPRIALNSYHCERKLHHLNTLEPEQDAYTSAKPVCRQPVSNTLSFLAWRAACLKRAVLLGLLARVISHSGFHDFSAQGYNDDLA